VLPVNMTASLYDAIMAKLPQVEFVDISIPVAQFRSVKSDEELYAIRQSRNIQVKVMEALPQIMRVGRTLGEMQKEISNYLTELGATGVRNGNIHYNGPMDEPLQGPPDAYLDHKLGYGDRYSCLLEVNGPGHQHIAFERHYSIGEPSKAYADTVANAIRVHEYAVSLMKPNVISLAQIAVKTRKFANTLGLELYESLGWNWMHGLGAFFYDQFALEDFTEDLPLQEGIMLHCHPLIFRTFPGFPNAREGIHLVNSYRIGAHGAEDLVGLPKDLIVLEP
jgi:Xaa-Pro aminopeptidase